MISPRYCHDVIIHRKWRIRVFSRNFIQSVTRIPPFCHLKTFMAGGAGGVFASNPSFLPGGVPVGVGGSVEDEASRVARERAAREETERRERERREFLEREALRKKAEEER